MDSHGQTQTNVKFGELVMNDNTTSSGWLSPVFFILTFALTLPVYVLMRLTTNGVILTPEAGFGLVPLATLAPISAALILTYRSAKWSGVKALLWRTFDHARVANKIWCVPAILLPPALVLLAYVIATVMGGETPSAQLPLIMAPVMFLAFFGGATSENIGWMGYAFGPMQDRLGAFGAALLLGVIVALWHTPMYLFLIDDPASLAALLLFPIALRILVVWIYNNTAASMFAAILLHAMYNLSYAVLPANLGNITVLSFIAAAAVVVLWGPKKMSKFQSPIFASNE